MSLAKRSGSTFCKSAKVVSYTGSLCLSQFQRNFTLTCLPKSSPALSPFASLTVYFVANLTSLIVNEPLFCNKNSFLTESLVLNL